MTVRGTLESPHAIVNNVANRGSSRTSCGLSDPPPGTFSEARAVYHLTMRVSALPTLLLAALTIPAAPRTAGHPDAPPLFIEVVLPTGLRDSMAAVWSENNKHWDELGDQNFLTQALGTGKPTQHEYLGCLVGSVQDDTLWVRALRPAANLRQLQFAVAGDCDHIENVVGTWHTHPYRAAFTGTPIKERGLSDQDLQTFSAASDLVSIVVWDRDSLDVAAKAPDGSVVHPAPLIVR